MKQPRPQCSYKDSQTHERCTSHIREVDESLCIKHDSQETIQTAALDRILKHHAKHCAYWIFSGDRHCSCGRDAALAELKTLKARAASGAAERV